LGALGKHLLTVADAVDLQIEIRVHKSLVNLGNDWVFSLVQLELQTNFEACLELILQVWIQPWNWKWDFRKLAFVLTGEQRFLIHLLRSPNMLLLRVVWVAVWCVQRRARFADYLFLHFILKEFLHLVIPRKKSFNLAGNRCTVNTQMPLGACWVRKTLLSHFVLEKAVGLRKVAIKSLLRNNSPERNCLADSVITVLWLSRAELVVGILLGVLVGWMIGVDSILSFWRRLISTKAIRRLIRREFSKKRGRVWTEYFWVCG